MQHPRLCLRPVSLCKTSFLFDSYIIFRRMGRAEAGWGRLVHTVLWEQPLGVSLVRKLPRAASQLRQDLRFS